MSAADMLPAAPVVAAEIEIAGVVPPEETIGAVPETLDTAPETSAAERVTAPVLPATETTELTCAPKDTLSSLSLSVADMEPAADSEAGAIEMVGVVPPEEAIGAAAPTEVTLVVPSDGGANVGTALPPLLEQVEDYLEGQPCHGDPNRRI